jgi:Ca2+-binding RTX toxin-like protein
MAYSITGTAGNDTLRPGPSDSPPGTIIGLAGDDCLLPITGPVSISGDPGNDTVFLLADNSGMVDGGIGNDSIYSRFNIDSMLLFGGDGADRIDVFGTGRPQTIAGGNDSNDDGDTIFGGFAADLILGNGGNDCLVFFHGNDTLVGGFGNDTLAAVEPSDGNQLLMGNEGNDSVFPLFDTDGGSDTVLGGTGDDFIQVRFSGASGGPPTRPLLFGNEGNDTITAGGANEATIAGGQDSADGSDSILGGFGPDFILGNGGADTIGTFGGTGADTVVGGFGGDCIVAADGSDVIFGNESDDTIDASGGADTVFGGFGNDLVFGGDGGETIQGNESNDTIQGNGAIDTIAGGTGSDVFAYASGRDDGDNAADNGRVERVTDVNWSEDRFDTATTITFATETGEPIGATIVDVANNAINRATALNGGVNTVAAQFTVFGRTYVAINLVNDGFLDTDDLLIEITGVTGTIAASNFI